ncbi:MULTISPECIES: bifunctional [glutamate--ammonia ligase]-adenylyl-L-tyrosine phosphorylase/[glutamate--ammonia-ligase] adenylyltransferase [Vitreoscilla]|uniref:Bifunctional glutamine synthetase adenylyltransferase/adenylyl-removing enzyme n=1 Tax=Vitreoscilla stercoraria TaxID=61 RepID=A0ABY4EAU5_VITST|nr:MULTISPECIES: bifunctional [glutamate--ammonia ligase]-adenylyl-L-tyrosine phosphorylase/[glutamate--ammonia-ligase] adenylyltransferase [Vitreoscilla]QJQ52364.1 glutamate-ammonia-ligase adenylyltransferase [Vitreoscilla sp. C1]UOO92873.1 bifunctional [glutamate--ammonia ligase]-adenylyl-L-tyrosine phosphorylase/[glutamate--ammonia-ligase] adenylyltransferase [Vitreoscilla stercoraria]
MSTQYLDQARPYSLYLQRQLDNQRLHVDCLDAWLQRPLSLTDFEQFAPWQEWIEARNEEALARELRILRRHVMVQIMTRDLCRLAPLSEVTNSITIFADFAVNIASNYAHHHYQHMYGQPIGSMSGEVQELTVIGMGKMGGYELNVSSDIDLIFVFPESGETEGKRPRSNVEFFTKVGQKIIALLNDLTAEGQVFRVDMRLRPDGESGALVLSESALERYLITQGREWERYAWIKGRIITAGKNDIANLVRPFVYRKYLDFDAYEGMRSLHSQIRQEVTKKGMTDNIKLGAGGIREVEFIAQIFQLIRGGRVRQLQRKDTQGTLTLLSQLGILEHKTSDKLLEAYRFLRDTEHRLQYWDDQQTQTLPEQEHTQILLAQSMGFDTYASFQDALNEHRQFVNGIFVQVLGNPDEQDTQTPLDTYNWEESVDDHHVQLREFLNQQGFEADTIINRLQTIYQSSRYRHLSNTAQTRVQKLMPHLFAAASATDHATKTLIRLLDFVDTINRRSSYLALLEEKPEALKRLAHIIGDSQWLADYLMRHPILLDDLLGKQLWVKEHDWQKSCQELNANLCACHGDVEAQMDALRHYQHSQVFRLAVQDLDNLWTVEAISDELSLLADCVLSSALQHLWSGLKNTHTETPKIAIIGYGKLGGKELAYASDLDLVFIYDDAHPDAYANYSRLITRLTTWLSATTAAGGLYDVDLRLRPDGDAGQIGVSVDAFRKYQLEKAWTWEHQSLTRARFVCGDEAVGHMFEDIRHQILTQSRDVKTLKTEIVAMRDKMLPTHPPLENNVKYARGGIVDVEFMVQYLVLAHAHTFPQLTQNYGNIALLGMAAAENLISVKLAEQAQTAYRHYRRVQHLSNLKDHSEIIVDSSLLMNYQNVIELWHNLFDINTV